MMIYKFNKNKMNKDIARYFLFFVIFLIMKSEGKEFNESINFVSKNDKNENDESYEITLKVKQTILEHASYYSNETNNDINKSFIDFSTFRFYYIDMVKVNNRQDRAELRFEFFFENDTVISKDASKDSAHISIRCTPEFRCNDVVLDEHQYISFDFDLLISQNGGVLSFLLILIGAFCLLKGYIYYNITTAFYSGLSIFLFFREYYELNELNDDLDTLDQRSQSFSKAVYYISMITSIAYGYMSIKTKYFKYISFGFIDGLVFSKVLFFLILMGLGHEKLLIKYLITEIVFCIAFIIFFCIFRNKNLKITIANISMLSSYGILYGLHILIGGLPFLPFLILSKSEDNLFGDENYIEKDLYEKLKNNSSLYVYVIFFVILSIIGFYFNYSNYKLFIEKKKKNISTL